MRPVTAIVVALLLIAVLVWAFLHEPEPTPQEAPPGPKTDRAATGSGDSRAPSPAVPPGTPTPVPPSPLPPPEPAGVPAEQLPATTDTSRERIAAIESSAEAAAVHRALTADLMTRIEELAGDQQPGRIKVAVQELAERFYLLDRVVKLRRLETPGPASLTPADKDQVDRILQLWQDNMALSLTVDQLFRERNLLPDEHVSQSLRKWMETQPQKE